jgi:ParB family chromosome partitioning protein
VLHSYIKEVVVMSNETASSQTATKPKRLGRGLTSILGIDDVSHLKPLSGSDVNEMSNRLSDVQNIPVNQISPSPYQPRQAFDRVALEQLAESIKRSGLLQPVLVRRSSGEATRFELVAGERRWRAAQAAGLATIPAIVMTLTDEQAAEHALVENVQREDLNPMDRAWGLRRLVERFGMSQAQVAERVGLERPTVANLIRLTELEPEITALISSLRLSAGHGKALLAVPPGPSRITLAKRAAEYDMSVRALEKLIQTGDAAIAGAGVFEGKSPAKPVDEARHAVLADLEKQIGIQLGTRVSITTDRRGKRGRISIEFYNLDHFDALMARLGVKTH